MENTKFTPWKSTLLRSHPLTGRIWLSHERRFINPGELAQRLMKAKYVGLGERHDNPDHHRIQAWITAGLIKHGARPALVMEMFRSNQQTKIDAHLAAHPGDAKGLGKAAGWPRSGWPPWRQYLPIVEPFVAEGLPLIAANLPRSRLRSVISHGYGALTQPERSSLRLEHPVAVEILDAMDSEIADAHCGFLKRANARPFTRVQLLRDALFAKAMREAAQRAQGAILIAGAGHVRRDRGVPYHLRRAGVKSSEIFALGIIEVAKDATLPGQYGTPYGVARPPFDAVWFTPRTARSDPCDGFKKYRKKK